ncbi:MAG: IS66 family transposase zinc-finger binding domain-containing protein [Burkholderia sp.]
MRGERDELRGELRVTKVERDPCQGDLFLNESERLAPTSATHGRRRKTGRRSRWLGHKRKPLDSALPREVIRYEMPADQLDIIPQQIRVIRHERVQYACEICDHGLKVAPVQPRIIPKGRFTEAALAWIMLSKFMARARL